MAFDPFILDNEHFYILLIPDCQVWSLNQTRHGSILFVVHSHATLSVYRGVGAFFFWIMTFGLRISASKYYTFDRKHAWRDPRSQAFNALLVEADITHTNRKLCIYIYPKVAVDRLFVNTFS